MRYRMARSEYLLAFFLLGSMIPIVACGEVVT